jgi:hypothetical protein
MASSNVVPTTSNSTASLTVSPTTMIVGEGQDTSTASGYRHGPSHANRVEIKQLSGLPIQYLFVLTIPLLFLLLYRTRRMFVRIAK